MIDERKRATPAEARAVTLDNGVEVRVGDVVPMTDGDTGAVLEVDCNAARFKSSVRVTIRDMSNGIWHYPDGRPNISDHPAIDLAALAAQRAKAPAADETLAREPGPTDDAIMGTLQEAKAKLMAATAKYREYRQPLIASAAENKARESCEREARFRLAEAAMLWLWHEERTAPAEAARSAWLRGAEAMRKAAAKDVSLKRHGSAVPSLYVSLAAAIRALPTPEYKP